MDYYSLLKSLVFFLNRKSLVFVVTENNFFQYLPKFLLVSPDVPYF